MKENILRAEIKKIEDRIMTRKEVSKLHYDCLTIIRLLFKGYLKWKHRAQYLEGKMKGKRTWRSFNGRKK